MRLARRLGKNLLTQIGDLDISSRVAGGDGDGDAGN